MQYIAALAFSAFGACFVALASGMLVAVRLFHSLEKNYPRYFKSIGEPVVFGYTPFPSVGDYVQRLKGAAFVYSMVFRGIPRDFPKDIEVRKLAEVVRYVFTATIILFTALVVLTYFYYKSGQ